MAMLDTSDVIAGFYTAHEGRADPANCAMSLAKGARMGGTRIVEDTAVTGFTLEKGRVTGVRTSRGEIECDHVVNRGGSGRDRSEGWPAWRCRSRLPNTPT